MTQYVLCWVSCCARAGEAIPVEVTAINSGNVPLTGVSISMPHVTLSCSSPMPAQLSLGEALKCTGQLTYTQDLLEGGDDVFATAAAADQLSTPAVTKALAVSVLAMPRLAVEIDGPGCSKPALDDPVTGKC